LNGEPRGTLVVYLDQSDQASALSSYFGLVAAITLILLGAGIAVPAVFAWMRSESSDRPRRRFAISRSMTPHRPFQSQILSAKASPTP
jgi:hypothetical protein